jgi:undecaprenyl-diphosphatase
VRARLLFLALLTCITLLPSRGDEAIAGSSSPVQVGGEPAGAAHQYPVAELSAGDSIILGLVEGITEFLPVSSTGHLIIANHALGLEGGTPLKDERGNLLWYKKPTARHPQGTPLTLKLAADTYIVVIQFGAIAAVLLLYSGQLLGILRGLAGRNADGLRLLRNLVLACLPAAFFGFLLKDWIDTKLFSIQAVMVGLISGAVLMWAAERWRGEQPARSTRLEPSELSPAQSVGIGFMQCLALWPGMSRSMVTMVGGYFCGLTPAKAAEFSFLIGLPTLSGAAAVKAVTNGSAMVTVFGWPHLLLGGVVAAVSAGIAVKFLVHYLTRHGLGLFAVYRILLAGLLAAWFFV